MAASARSFGEPAYVSSVAIDSQGRIVVAGEIGYSASPNEDDFALARYKPNGSPDPAFGGDGVVRTDFDGRGDAASDVAIDSQGRILAAGYAQRRAGARAFLTSHSRAICPTAPSIPPSTATAG